MGGVGAGEWKWLGGVGGAAIHVYVDDPQYPVLGDPPGAIRTTTLATL